MTKTPSLSQPREIVIVGAGLIGVSTAYHLSRHPDLPPESRITLVEEDDVGTGSSGYASGLLVRNQGEGDELSTIGFDLHKSLAKDFGGELKWGYKPINLYNTILNPTNTSNGHPSSSPPPPLPFLPSTAQIDHPHPTKDTAIINPSDLTRHLCGLFLTHPGGSLRIARATSLTFDDHSKKDKEKQSRLRVNGINIVQIINGIEEIVHLRADTIILCTGIKTPSLLSTFLGIAVEGLDIRSKEWEGVVLKTKQKHRPCAVKIEGDPGQGKGEGEGDVTLVVRDDGKIVVSRPIPAITNNSPNLLKFLESLSPQFSSSAGTLILSQTQWSAPLTPNDKPLFGSLSDIASEMEVDGIWVGVGGDTTQGPAIGSKLSRSILEKI